MEDSDLVEEIVVGAPRFEPTQAGTRLHFPVSLAGSDAGFSITLPPGLDPPPAHATPAVPPALILAMASGRPLLVDAPASSHLAKAVGQIQDMLHTWYPQFRKVPVDWTELVDAGSPRPGTAAFFSGGVDSTYLALKHLDDLDALVFFRHFLPFPRPEAEALGDARVRHAANELGKRLVVIDTDVSRTTDQVVHWYLGHGAGLASIAHGLAASFGRFLIAGYSSYAFLEPWGGGSHPLLDALWSSESVTIQHDAEATRAEKTIRIATHPTVRRHLWVCWEQLGPGANCGRCPKCLQVMIAMEIAGSLRHSEVFPEDRLDLRRVALLPTAEARMRSESINEMLRFAEERHAPAGLVLALRVCAIRQRLGSVMRRWLAARPRLKRALGQARDRMVGRRER